MSDCVQKGVKSTSLYHGRPLQQLTLSIDVVMTLISLNKLCKTSTCTQRLVSSDGNPSLRTHKGPSQTGTRHTPGIQHSLTDPGGYLKIKDENGKKEEP